MRSARTALLAVPLLLYTYAAHSQTNRIRYNNQSLFLSGANLAWVSFAHDIGPGNTDLARFEELFLSMHDQGGNAARWWLHTNGTASPAFNDTGLVIAPGPGTIEDLRAVLDLAWEREIGLKLCLWSFDMLRSSNAAAILDRNRKMLQDTAFAQAYVRDCLIPLVDSLKGHPAIIAWEVFNEPEGMSNEFGWSDIQHVPMASIQRFINLCAGAIHRTDTSALVTSGSWAFTAMTDVATRTQPDTYQELVKLSPLEKRDIETRFEQKYAMKMSADEIFRHVDRVRAAVNQNYYADDRLIAAGGDSTGTLDFYSIHYYDWAGTTLSPFHHIASSWNLDKPIVVAEFAIKDTYSVPKMYLYSVLHGSGYAGALAWSWTDAGLSSGTDILAALKFMWDRYRSDVDIVGIGGDWPVVNITSPAPATQFPDSADVTIVASASDPDGTVAKVEFFASDTIVIGEALAEPFQVTWVKPTAGMYSLTAIATDNQGHRRTSARISIQVGTPPFVRMEAEAAARSGSMSVMNHPGASNGQYVNMPTQTGTVTWTVPNVPTAGTYTVYFGFRLAYDTPKNQFINVNGTRAVEFVFDGPTSTWREKSGQIAFQQGQNTIQLELGWGWMDIDYLAVPKEFFLTDADGPAALPHEFALTQNFPNPFNPATTMRYSMARKGHVRLVVLDLLGRECARLVDGTQDAGWHVASFDARLLTSGVYFYRLEASGASITRRMVLMK